jgi:Zn-dependent protease with chaperone function
MNTRLRVFLFTLALPVFATAMAWACIAKVDSNLRDQVRQKYPSVSEAKIAALTVSSLAAQGGFSDSSELPTIYANLKLARLTAALTGVIGLGLVGVIFYAGYATRTRRDLLLRLFRPGLFLTLSMVGVLTAAQAIAAAYALYYFESIFIERVHYILIIGVSIGGVLALVAVVRAMFSLKYSSEFKVLGRNATREDQPALWQFIDTICAELHATPPDNIVLGLEPSFYVTESDVLSSDGRLQGRTLFLSLSLSRLVSVAELRAVVGHEMAHFIGKDTVFSQRFFPVYRGTLVALSNLSRNAVHGSVAIAQLPAIAFLGFFFESFVTSEKNLSRLRETEADAIGARVGGATQLATALVKVHAYTGGWQPIVEDLRFDHERLRAETNLSLPLQAHALAITAEEVAKAGENHVFHPTDSHPPLSVRLQSLQTDLATMVALTAVPQFELSAAVLVANLEDLERIQSGELREVVRPSR